MGLAEIASRPGKGSFLKTIDISRSSTARAQRNFEPSAAPSQERSPSSSLGPTAARRAARWDTGHTGSDSVEWTRGLTYSATPGGHPDQVIAGGPADQRFVKASSRLEHQSTSNSATGTSGAELLGTSGWARRLCSPHARDSTHIGPRGTHRS